MKFIELLEAYPASTVYCGGRHAIAQVLTRLNPDQSKGTRRGVANRTYEPGHMVQAVARRALRSTGMVVPHVEVTVIDGEPFTIWFDGDTPCVILPQLPDDVASEMAAAMAAVQEALLDG